MSNISLAEYLAFFVTPMLNSDATLTFLSKVYIVTLAVMLSSSVEATVTTVSPSFKGVIVAFVESVESTSIDKTVVSSAVHVKLGFDTPSFVFACKFNVSPKSTYSSAFSNDKFVRLAPPVLPPPDSPLPEPPLSEPPPEVPSSPGCTGVDVNYKPIVTSSD